MVDLESASKVYACVGGSGVTPAIALAGQIAMTDASVELHILWAVPTRTSAEPFLKELQEAIERNPLKTTTMIKAIMFVTRASNEMRKFSVECPIHQPGDGGSLKVKEGRPDWSALIEEGPGTVAFACGPGRLMNEVDRVCLGHGVPLHKETFEL
eukprot:Hpha_TRINITY_DN15429_c5_g2::TRINITY_DN15429_c5_g2_i2::g.173402::m.173402